MWGKRVNKGGFVSCDDLSGKEGGVVFIFMSTRLSLGSGGFATPSEDYIVGSRFMGQAAPVLEGSSEVKERQNDTVPIDKMFLNKFYYLLYMVPSIRERL